MILQKLIRRQFDQNHGKISPSFPSYLNIFNFSSTRHMNSTNDPNSEQHRKLFIGGLSFKYVEIVRWKNKK